MNAIQEHYKRVFIDKTQEHPPYLYPIPYTPDSKQLEYQENVRGKINHTPPTNLLHNQQAGLTGQNILKKPGGEGETPSIPSRSTETGQKSTKRRKPTSNPTQKQNGENRLKMPLKQIELNFD